MATQVPPLRASAFSFEVALVSQGDTDLFQTSVTMAVGDCLVSKDGGAFANIGTLPSEIGSSGVLTVALTGAEMTADRVVVLFNDAAGDEWQDLLVSIHTVTTSQVDDLATAAVVTEARLAELDAANIPADLDAVLAATNELQADDVPGLIAALNDLSAAAINAEVSDVIKTDTIAELAQAIPPSTPTLETAIMYLYMALRNRVDVDGSDKEFHDDADTVVWKKALSDSGSVYTEAKGASGP